MVAVWLLCVPLVVLCMDDDWGAMCVQNCKHGIKSVWTQNKAFKLCHGIFSNRKLIGAHMRDFYHERVR